MSRIAELEARLGPPLKASDNYEDRGANVSSPASHKARARSMIVPAPLRATRNGVFEITALRCA